MHWVRFVLGQPLAGWPGTRFADSSEGCLDLVVVIACDEVFRPDPDVASTLIGDVIPPATRR